ncbi:MAG TPA: hypothetical protein VGM38_02200 [Pseudolysinimonas sp.]
MLKKLLAALGTLALVLGLVALVAGPASAHNHTVSASCDAGVSVDLTNYATGDSSKHNTVEVWIDGVVATNNPSFGGSFSKTYPFSTGQASHTYRVLVYAYDNNAAYGFDTGVVTVKGCETDVTPAPPTSTNPYCTAAGTVGGGGYTIPTQQTGVKYQLWNSGTSSWNDISAGTYSANPGAVIKIQAIATTGYKLKHGETTSWTFTLTNPNASKCVVPVPPTADASECTATPGSSTTATYTIPTAPAGYKFYPQGSGTPLTAGTVNVTTFPTTIVIVATANSGYHFPSGTTTTWTFTFSSPGDCHVNVTPATVVPQYATCNGPGTSSNNGYTITATAGVIYHLSTNNTPLTAGFHNLGSSAGSVEIQATADAHYALTGTADWTFTFLAAAECLVPTPVGDPEFVDGTCDAANPGSAILGTYTVLVASHVTYVATVNGGPSTPLVVGVHNPAQQGATVVITPIVEAGYVISPAIADENLTHTFTVLGDCLVKADFVKPSATSQSCVVTGTDDSLDSGDTQTGAVSESHLSTASLTSSSVNAQLATVPQVKAVVTHTLTDAFITIPSLADSPHVTYFIDGAVAAPGKHILDPGTYVVSAMANTGYFLDGYNGPWTEVLASATPCGDLITHPLVDPSAVQVQMGCLSNGSYTLSNDLSDAAALTWTVNGSIVSQGTYKVGTVSTVTVHAAPSGPSYGLEDGATTDWTFHFERPTSCDLTTLALTGSTPTGWIIFGYALLVSGLALVALRFARRREEEA